MGEKNMYLYKLYSGVFLMFSLTAMAQSEPGEELAQPVLSKQETAVRLTEALDASTAELRQARTLLRSQSDLLALNRDKIAGFPDTIITCPLTATNGCTVRVSLSSQFWSISKGATVYAQVSIDGNTGMSPQSTIGMDSNTVKPYASTSSFQWVKQGIPAGATQTLTAGFWTAFQNDLTNPNVSAKAGFRTLSIDIFKN
jgi:hypothetical protein